MATQLTLLPRRLFLLISSQNQQPLVRYEWRFRCGTIRNLLDFGQRSTERSHPWLVTVNRLGLCPDRGLEYQLGDGELS